jgi:FixJ family two-component response regulator
MSPSDGSTTSNQPDPSEAAARNLDWQDLYAELPRREKAIITLMVQGKSGSAIARKLKVTVSAIQTGKRHLAKAIVEFMGPAILQEVMRRPQWKDSLDATRERRAVRYDRSH